MAASEISQEAYGVTSETIRAFLGTEQGYTSLVKEDLSQPQTTTAAKYYNLNVNRGDLGLSAFAIPAAKGVDLN
ncbi:hypothetical protein MKW98_006179 [Papaver atlanticum]|uniref:Uncharacterized protein n=1 Tax=Papaver atlanticum TaxID=357466 RepID=A0AAD4TE33_9MAGN|nr:hypothetical protein MKW98_006179 [Papaver atlanticum]